MSDAPVTHHPPAVEVLRGGSLVPAPFTLLGALALAVAVASALWMAWGDRRVGLAAWAVLLASLAVGCAGLAAARGCRVVIRDATVLDQVAWRTVHRVAQQDVVGVRVRRGPWRVFEAELADGTRRVVLGAGPQQFPVTISGQAREHDLATIELIMGAAGTTSRPADP
jgi:hypothetical protein